MTKITKDILGRWIGNILIVVSILSILYVYFDLYKNGHFQCSKTYLENRTFIISSFGYALLIVIIGSRFSSSKKIDAQLKKLPINRRILVVIGTFLGVIIVILYLLAGIKIQNLIEKSVENRIENQLKLDGVPTIGIVRDFYTKSYSRRNSKIEREQIEFEYERNGKIINTCYSLKLDNRRQYKIGDKLKFVISQSKPEYILLKD